jgi:hypothetical protein
MKIKIGLLLVMFTLTGCPFDETEKCVEAQVKAEQLTICKNLKGDDESKCQRETKIFSEAPARLACLKAKAGG